MSGGKCDALTIFDVVKDYYNLGSRSIPSYLSLLRSQK